MADIEYRYGLKMVHTIVREIGRAFLIIFLMLISYYIILARPSMIGISRFDQNENFMYSYILKNEPPRRIHCHYLCFILSLKQLKHFY